MTTESTKPKELSEHHRRRIRGAVTMYLIYAIAVWPVFFAFTWFTGPNSSLDVVVTRFDPLLAMAGSGVCLLMGLAEFITIRYPNKHGFDPSQFRSKGDQ